MQSTLVPVEITIVAVGLLLGYAFEMGMSNWLAQQPFTP